MILLSQQILYVELSSTHFGPYLVIAICLNGVQIVDRIQNRNYLWNFSTQS